MHLNILPKCAPPKPQKETEGCNQSFLNAFNFLSDLGAASQEAGNNGLKIAGVMAVTGLVAESTVVGAPAGATLQAGAGALASASLVVKAGGGLATLIGDVGAGIETGNRAGSATAIGNALLSLIPGSKGIVGQVAQDQVTEQVSQNSRSGRRCPSGG